MRILIAGALGHIGSHLIRSLPKALPGAEILMLDSMMTQRYPSLFALPPEGRYRFIECDVARADLRRFVEGCDVVICLAAITDAASSFDHADRVEENNFTATRLLAEACVATGAGLIFPSSTSVYGTQSGVIDEDCPEAELKPQSPYAATKLREERLIAGLCAEKGLRAVICRLGTIYGVSPGMRFHTAVNKFCWQAVLGQPVTVWSSAYDQKRPYLDLTDCGRAMEFIIARDLFDGRIYNVITANHTVRDVVDTIRRSVPDLQVKFVDSPIMNQLSYEVLPTRMRAKGFMPEGSLGRGIGDTVALLRAANGSPA